jgi:GNAT superfamily N-acetyltransferase
VIHRRPADTPLGGGGSDLEIAVLRDGRAIGIRSVGRSDEPALRVFLHRLSDRSRAMRFFSSAANTDVAAAWAAAADGREEVGLIALDGTRVIAHAMYARVRETLAEVAVEVADDYQHAGVATLLLIRLARYASERGVVSFIADVLAENSEMLEVFDDVFGASEVREDLTDIESRFATAGWRRAAERFDGDWLARVEKVPAGGRAG